MYDYVVTLVPSVLLAGAALLVWRRVLGPSRSALRSTGRIALAVAVALLVVGLGVYNITKSRSFQFAGELVQRVETDEKVVALTFDDGPEPGYTQEVLDTLRSYDASATFYLTGEACERDPALLRAIIADGHELGNHTFTHSRTYFLSDSAVAEEIERTDSLFRSAGYTGPITFRMPGCKRLVTTPLYLARTGRTTVTWDLEPDSIAGVAEDPDAIVESVVDGVSPGSIVLLHAMYGAREPTREALPRILERLSADGYRFVTVSELLAMR